MWDWIGFSFWVLICAAAIFFVGGLIKGSSKLLFISGVAIALPSLYFIGAENGLQLLALLPLLLFFLAFYLRRKNS